MKKEPFVTLEQLQEITKTYPTPFHLYDEKGIRENAKALKEAFSWNKGYKEYFAVKATPNPFLINILREYGCGCDCSSMTELMLANELGVKGEDIMFSSNDTPAEEFEYAAKIWTIIPILIFWRRPSATFRKLSAAVSIRAESSRSATISWTIRATPSTV